MTDVEQVFDHRGMLDVAIRRVDGSTGIDLGTKRSPPWPVDPTLADVLPDGLRRGSTVSVAGSVSLLLAVLGGPSSAGAWCALIGLPLVVAYSAAKSAYSGLVRSLAAEYGPRGVRVNAIAPGWIASDMLNAAFAGDPQRHAKVISRTPMGRLGEPDDVGWAAVYLSSPAAKFVTGMILTVDGGAATGF